MQQSESMGSNGDQRRPGPSPEEAFATRVKERRERMNLTQTQLAAALREYQGLEIDGTAITRLERGERRVRLDEAVAIVTVLGLDLYEAIAPHPGDLDEQIERAQAGVFNATYAENYWRREREASQQRVDELRAVWDQVQRDKQELEKHIESRRLAAEGRGDFESLYDTGWQDGADDGVDPEEA